MVTLPQIGPMATLPQSGPMATLPQIGPMVTIPQIGPMVTLPQSGTMVTLPQSGPMAKLPQIGPRATLCPHCKRAEVGHAHKKDELLNKKNYRPVSILISISKVIEKCINIQMNAFNKQVLSDMISAYRKGYSCQ